MPARRANAAPFLCLSAVLAAVALSPVRSRAPPKIYILRSVKLDNADPLARRWEIAFGGQGVSCADGEANPLGNVLNSQSTLHARISLKCFVEIN